MTKGVYNDYIKPFVVLVVICLVAALVLGYTNSVTAPIIEENERVKAEETRAAVLPGAADFEELDVSDLVVDSAFRETSGLGYVMSASYKGYGGLVTVTVGLDNDGKIVGISADVGTETVGVGSKAGQEAYTSKYLGLTGTAASVDTISGATYSSTAVKNSVNEVLSVFDEVRGR